MRPLAVLFCVLAMPLGAQQPGPPPPPDSARAESTALPPPAPPPPPSPEQKHFLEGLHTATRGIAQLKDGLGRVARAQATSDAAAERRAGRFLAGLCGSARAFLRRGRPQMNSTAYADSARLMARRLLTQMDSLIAYAPSCEHDGRATPQATADALTKHMKTYDTALRDFKVAIGMRVSEDSSKTPKKQ